MVCSHPKRDTKFNNKENNNKMNKFKLTAWLYTILRVISRFFKIFFVEFWNGCTVRTSEKVSFEFGGFILCIWFVIGLFWLLGLI